MKRRSFSFSDTAILIILAACGTLLHILLNGQYGFHRDELDIIMNARQLDWGYVAYPPFTPVIARIGLILFGNSLRGLRVFSALAQGVVMLLAGWMARDMGGGRFAQASAAERTATARPATARPATVADATRVLDLTTFPAMKGAKEPLSRSVSRLSYNVPGDCQTAFDFHRKTLTSMKWSEVSGSSVTKDYGSGMFTRDGFLASVSVSPPGPS